MSVRSSSGEPVEEVGGENIPECNTLAASSTSCCRLYRVSEFQVPLSDIGRNCDIRPATCGSLIGGQQILMMLNWEPKQRLLQRLLVAGTGTARTAAEQQGCRRNTARHCQDLQTRSSQGSRVAEPRKLLFSADLDERRHTRRRQVHEAI